MKTLSTSLINQKNKLSSTGAWLILLEITLNDTGSTILRFVRNTEDVTFGGEVYEKMNFTLEQSGATQGQIPNYSLNISNVNRILEPYLENLNGGISSTVKITVVNSELLSEDYTELEISLEVLDCSSDANFVTFTLGAPNPLRQMFPSQKYSGLHCQFNFETVECGYTGKVVAGVTLSGSNPVLISVTDHGWIDGLIIRVADLAGITPALAGPFAITKNDDNSFYLDGTSSADYSGTYTSGGVAGFEFCERRLTDCRERENSPRFGAQPGIRTGTIRVV